MFRVSLISFETDWGQVLLPCSVCKDLIFSFSLSCGSIFLGSSPCVLWVSVWCSVGMLFHSNRQRINVKWHGSKGFKHVVNAGQWRQSVFWIELLMFWLIRWVPSGRHRGGSQTVLSCTSTPPSKMSGDSCPTTYVYNKRQFTMTQGWHRDKAGDSLWSLWYLTEHTIWTGLFMRFLFWGYIFHSFTYWHLYCKVYQGIPHWLLMCCFTRNINSLLFNVGKQDHVEEGCFKSI